VLIAGICSFSDILLLCRVLCYFNFVAVFWLQSSSFLLHKKAKFSPSSSLNLQEGKKKGRVNKLLLWQ